jgi:hypothetical protein
MNAPTASISFVSAYRQLRPHEKAYVDNYVQSCENEANRRGERISLALHRAIPADVVEASRGLLDKPLVRAAIAERITDIAAANELTPHRVIKEWMCLAFSSVGDYMEVGEDGAPWFDLTKCTPEQLAAIKSIEVEETGDGISRPKKRKFKFQLHDKIAGLDALAKYMGLLQPDNPFWRQDNARPVNGGGGLPATVGANDAADRYAQMING